MRLGGASFTLHVRSAMEAIGPASEQAESWLAMQRVSSDAASLVSLAIEELVTNCTKYGYDDSNDHTVDIVHSVDDGALSPPDLSLAMENRLIGGLGIHLLRDANVQEPTDPALKPNRRLKTHGKAPRLLIVW